MKKGKKTAFQALTAVFLTSLLTCHMVSAAEEMEIVPQEITYWSMWEEDEKQAEVILEAAEAYEKSTGIHVNIQWKGRSIKTLIGPALDAGASIDLFDDDYQRIVQQDRAYVSDLNDLGSTVDYETHIIPAFLNQIKEWGNGKVYVLPYQPYMAGVWYDKELWEEAGLTDEDIPQNYDDLLKVCGKIKNSETGLSAMTCDEDSIKLLYGAQLAGYLGPEKVWELINQCTWDQVPEAEQAARDIWILFRRGYMSEQSPAAEKEGQKEVGEGKSVMELQASWMPNEVLQDTGAQIDWGFFPWPKKTGEEGQEGAIAGAQGFGVIKTSKMQQEAFDFAYLVCTGEYDLELAQSVNSIPADTDNAVQWPELILAAKEPFLQLKTPYMWAAGLEEKAEYSDKIQENLLNLVKSRITPIKFIQEMSEMDS